MGLIVYFREKYKDSYEYLQLASKIGETIKNEKIIGYACTWLTWTCSELGLLDEAIDHGKRAQKIAKILGSDHYLFFKSLGGIALAYNYKGEIKNILEAGKRLLDYGQRHSNIRSTQLGYQAIGWSHMMAGNFELAKEFALKGASVSVDPIYSLSGKISLGFIYSMHGQLIEIEEEIKEIETFSRNYGYGVWGSPARLMYGAICIAKGRMSHGLKIIEAVQQEYKENGRKFMLGYSEQVLANIYLQILEGAKPASLVTMAKNIGFLLKNVPSAAEKAEKHLHKALEIAEELGSKSVIAWICLDMGRLHKLKNRTQEAKDCVARAIKVFEEIEAEAFLQQAKKTLASLK
jgi:tetratricopeptide (TPR) repeat protein